MCSVRSVFLLGHDQYHWQRPSCRYARSVLAVCAVRPIDMICVPRSYNAYAGAPLRSNVNSSERSAYYYRRKKYSAQTQVYRAKGCKILRVVI